VQEQDSCSISPNYPQLQQGHLLPRLHQGGERPPQEADQQGHLDHPAAVPKAVAQAGAAHRARPVVDAALSG